MEKVIGVRFEGAGKLYYFSPGNFWPEPGCFVVVETEQGLSLGRVITHIKEVKKEELTAPLKTIVRIASRDDILHQKENEKKEAEAFEICKAKIQEHNLEMKLVKAQYTLDNSKLLFFFTANGRVDFRLLVKDLASIFHIRIELRQIGVRDEAKTLGSLGPCGRPICCGRFLGDFQAVGIRMAKEQNLSLNPTKISGVCGRLMCCLTFEEEHYEKTRQRMPRIGKEIETPEGIGMVVDTNIIKEQVVVRFRKGDSFEQKPFALEVLKFDQSSLPSAEDVENDNTPDNPEKPTHEASAPHVERVFKRNLNRKIHQNRFGSASLVQESSAAVAPHSEEAPKTKRSNWMKAVEEALRASEKAGKE